MKVNITLTDKPDGSVNIDIRGYESDVENTHETSHACQYALALAVVIDSSKAVPAELRAMHADMQEHAESRKDIDPCLH